MAIQVVFARAGGGKTHYVTECIRARLGKGKSYLAVPEQYTHIAEHKLLKSIGSISVESVEVTSFKKMISKTERKLGIENILSPVAKSIIVSDILSCVKLDYFSAVKEREGFSDVCLSLIGEFKKYCVTPEKLGQALENEQNPRLKMKLADILCIYTEYEKRIAEAGFDADDGAGVLAETVSKGNDFDNTVFFFDEYTSFIPQEMAIIKAIAKKAEDVVITLCSDGKDNILFAPTMDTAEKIKKMCAEENIEYKTPIILSEGRKHCEEIAFVEKNLLPYPKGKYNGDCENVNIFSAANPYEEVSDTARRILRLCRDGGYRYRDIAVVCSDIATYAPFIRPVFEAHNISYFIDEKTPVVKHGIISFILNILDIYLNDYSNETVFAFLKSGFCNSEKESVYTLENYCKRTNMHKSTYLNEEKWNNLAKKCASAEEAEKICAVREKHILPLCSFHEKIKGRHSANHMCRALYEYITEINLDEKIGQYLKKFEKYQDVKRGEEYEKIWNIIIDALDSVSSVLGEKTVNVSTFKSILQTAFSGYSIGLIPTSMDEVSIGNISRSKNDGIKVLFVLGANDGVFPMSAKNEDLINDDDKKCLAESGIELSEDTKTKAFFERFYMYSTFATPSERLFISFSRSSMSSDALRPSFVLSDFKRIFPDLVVESDLLQDRSDFGQMEYITTKNPTLEKLAEEITRYKNGEEVSEVWLDVYDYFCANFDFGTKLKKYYSYTNIAKDIDEKVMEKFIPEEFYTTISRLQRYRSCAFSYFLEYMLKLKENNVFEISAMDTGSFVHSVIENLCVCMKDDGVDFKTVTDDYVLNKIDFYIDEFVKKLSDESSHVTKRQLYLVKRLKGAIKKCFDLVKEHIASSSFVPLGYEIRFDDKNIGCIEFDLGSGKKAKITGVIDRGDVYHGQDGDYIRVIDYKTGNKEFNLSDVFYGLDVQLFVYLNALVESNDNYKYAGALYFRIDDPIYHGDHKYDEDKTESKILSEIKMKGLVLGEEAVLSATDEVTASSAKKASYKNFTDLSRHLKKTISDLCGEIARGKIDIKPYSKGNFTPCQYCSYNTVCRFDPSKKGNNYEYLPSFKDDEIWESIGGESNVD